MNKLGNTTILIISNDIAAIANLTDTLNIMYCGQMVEVGTRDQILESLTTLYGCPAQVHPRL
jgi:cationic peptide transport system ATP-binding protein